MCVVMKSRYKKRETSVARCLPNTPNRSTQRLPRILQQYNRHCLRLIYFEQSQQNHILLIEFYYSPLNNAYEMSKYNPQFHINNATKSTPTGLYPNPCGSVLLNVFSQFSLISSLPHLSQPCVDKMGVSQGYSVYLKNSQFLTRNKSEWI